MSDEKPLHCGKWPFPTSDLDIAMPEDNARYHQARGCCSGGVDLGGQGTGGGASKPQPRDASEVAAIAASSSSEKRPIDEHEHCDHWWDDAGPCCRCGDDSNAGQSDAGPREPGRLTGCVFCEIVGGTAPAEVVREWDDALCIVPLNPVTPGHVLVLPKRHVASFFTSPDVSAATMRRAAEMLHGVERHHEPRDHNVITSAGEAATQTVMHLHVHIVPRSHGDGLPLPWTPQQTAEVRSRG